MERKPYPGFWHAVLLCVLFQVWSVVFAVPMAVLDVVLKTGWSTHPGFAAVVNTLACAATLAIAFLIGRPPVREVFAFRAVGAAALLAATAATVGLVILISDLDNLLRLVLPQPKWIQDMFARLFSAKQHPIASFVLLVVVAPLTEELMFRGLMLRGLLGRFAAPKAILIVAALFAVVHLNPWQALGAIVLGVLLGWFYVRTRSLLPPLLGHAIANGVVFLLPFLPFEIPGFRPPDVVGPLEFQPWWLDVAGAGMLALGVWSFASLTAPSLAAAPTGPAVAEQGAPPAL